MPAVECDAPSATCDSAVGEFEFAGCEASCVADSGNRAGYLGGPGAAGSTTVTGLGTVQCDVAGGYSERDMSSASCSHLSQRVAFEECGGSCVPLGECPVPHALCAVGTDFEFVGCEDTDECAGRPCEHGGVCMESRSCDSEDSVCGMVGMFAVRCGDGSCVPRPALDAYTCVCAAGWSGPDCVVDVDECASDPCVNGAVCYDSRPWSVSPVAAELESFACQGSVNSTADVCEPLGMHMCGESCVPHLRLVAIDAFECG